jgi:chemotaxis protein methyltransferase CheR
MIPDLPKWNITILATDVNPVSIRKASGGEYGEWSFRGVPRWLKEKYFTLNGKGRYKLSDSIRKMVTFARLNLADDPYPSLLNNTNAMDIIFCRNVLMYFSPDRIKKTVSGFRHSLLDGGWLVVSPCEVSHVLFPGFEPVSFNDAVFYRKERQGQPAAARFSGKVDSEGVFGACTGKSPLTPLCQRGGDIDERNGAADSDLVTQPPPAAPFPATTSERDDSVTRLSPYEEALALYRQGEYGDAAAILVEYIADCPPGSVPPSHGEASVLLARALANQGRFAEALEWLEKAVAFDRLNPKPYYLQATIFQEQGYDDAAVVSLKKAIYVDHGFVLAHFALASLNLRRGKRKEAVRHLENAASLLNEHGDDDILPGADGLSARRLAGIIAETRDGLN